MALQWFSGLIFGMATFWNPNFQGFTPLPETSTSLSQFFLSNNTLQSQFHLPLSEQAFQEFQSLQGLIQALQVDQNSRDSWEYIWGSKNYSSSKCYNFPYKNIQPPAPFLWIWNAKCCNKL
jgi:hypothetical protein